jgi:hypothetical protein
MVSESFWHQFFPLSRAEFEGEVPDIFGDPANVAGELCTPTCRNHILPAGSEIKS